jgi:hypothetical protein
MIAYNIPSLGGPGMDFMIVNEAISLPSGSSNTAQVCITIVTFMDADAANEMLTIQVVAEDGVDLLTDSATIVIECECFRADY